MLCWDYALSWRSPSVVSRLQAAGVAGPLFISVGEPEQLRRFLDSNPEVDSACSLIDDSADFSAYKAAGFNHLLGEKTLDEPPNFKPPRTLSAGKWWAYMKNAAQLAPQPAGGAKLGQMPKGTLVLGGTYAIDGDAVKFGWMDAVPGATPDIETVLQAVGA